MNHCLYFLLPHARSGPDTFFSRIGRNTLATAAGGAGLVGGGEGGGRIPFLRLYLFVSRLLRAFLWLGLLFACGSISVLIQSVIRSVSTRFDFPFAESLGLGHPPSRPLV
jgi:hypothetical protein